MDFLAGATKLGQEAGPVKNIEERIKTMRRLSFIAIVIVLAVVAIPTALALTERTSESEIT